MNVFPEETSYVFRDGEGDVVIMGLCDHAHFLTGVRCVQPYYFTFTSHAKGRWVGSTIYDMFTREFQSETAEYYVSGDIPSGRGQGGVIP